MSERRIPAAGREMEALLREVLHRLDNLEKGTGNSGNVSFGSIQIGNVQITVTKGAGLHRNVVFTNLLSGVTSTIAL